MNKHILLVIIMAIIFGSCATTGQKKEVHAPKTATFMFYNVENLFDTINDPKIKDDEFTPQSEKKWNSKRYYKKLDNLASVIALIDANRLPEFIGVSEIENAQVLEDLAASSIMEKYKYKVAHHESNDGRGIDVGLMYQSEAFRLIHSELVPINYKPKADDYLLREILYVKGEFYALDTLHIFVNHWKSRRGGESETEIYRVKTAETLRKKTEEILENNADAKIIICGDMNDEPENKSLSVALGAKATIAEAKTSGLYNLMFAKSLAGKGTYSYRGSWNMLDNLIVSRGLIDAPRGYSIESEEGEIVYDDKILYENPKADGPVPNKTYGGDNYYGGFSDHLPVYFKMKLK